MRTKKEEPKQPCAECGNDYAEGYCPHMKPKAKRSKKTYGDHVAEHLKDYKGPCTKTKRCAFLSAVLAVSKEDKKDGAGITEGFSFSTKGGYQGTEVVYYARRAQYVVMNHCPFCGGKIGKKR
jgi:hypothetical protein